MRHINTRDQGWKLQTIVLSEHFTDEAIAAVVHRAEFHAEVVGTFLRSAGSCPEGEIRLPASALLELAAVLQLVVWEEYGLAEYLDSDLPDATEAVNALIARCLQGRTEFQKAESTTLSRRVLQAYIDRLAWDGAKHLQADIIVSEVDDDVFIDQLAGLLWRHRHVLDPLDEE